MLATMLNRLFSGCYKLPTGMSDARGSVWCTSTKRTSWPDDLAPLPEMGAEMSAEKVSNKHCFVCWKALS